MRTETDFLRSIHETPEDDDLRLVFADWLDEEGDPRAEFIRIQIALARHPHGLATRVRLEQQNRDLLARHSKQWFGPLAKHADICHFHRGTLHLWGSARQLLGDYLETEDVRQPCEWVEVMHVSGLDRASIPRLGHFPHLTSLASADTELSTDTLESLESIPALLCLRTLSFSQSTMHDTGVAALAACPSLPRLRTLDLGDTRIGNQGLRALAMTEHLPSLAVVNLQENRNITSEGCLFLAGSRLLERLISLDLSRTTVSDHGITILFPSGRFDPLPLNRLCLSGNDLSDLVLHLVASCPQLGQLTALELSGTQVGSAGLRALASSSHVRSLTVLELGYTSVGDDGLLALAASPLFSRLTQLGLRYCQGVSDAGVSALAGSRVAEWLTHLELEGTSVGDPGGLALARSPYLTRLERLRLTGSSFSTRTRSDLQGRFGERVVFF